MEKVPTASGMNHAVPSTALPAPMRPNDFVALPRDGLSVCRASVVPSGCEMPPPPITKRLPTGTPTNAQTNVSAPPLVSNDSVALSIFRKATRTLRAPSGVVATGGTVALAIKPCTTAVDFTVASHWTTTSTTPCTSWHPSNARHSSLCRPNVAGKYVTVEMFAVPLGPASTRTVPLSSTSCAARPHVLAESTTFVTP